MLENKLYNNEAEQELLGIMLIDNAKVVSIKALVNDKDFFSKSHQYIFNTIVELVDKGKVADIVTVSELLDFNSLLEQCGGREYINTLALSAITTTNYKNYCGIVVNYSKKRKLIAMCESAISNLTNNTDVDDVAIAIKTNTEEIMINKTSDNLSHIFNGVDGVVTQVESILSSETKLLGLPTPYTKLNKMLSGLVKGRLYILGARPAMGKTSMLLNIARTVSVNHNVVLASLEMGLEELTQRELFADCNTNQDMLSNGFVKEDIYEKLYKASEKLADLKLYVIDNPECTLNTIENGIINCIAKNGGCDLVCVDYLQLMKPSDKRKKDDYDIVTANSKGLKVLARKYNVPVVALCQLSRDLERRPDKRPILSDLRDSGAIEQDADVVMFIYRDEVYNPNGGNEGNAELLVRKNRQGKTGTLGFVFEASKTKFTERKDNYVSTPTAQPVPKYTTGWRK